MLVNAAGLFIPQPFLDYDGPAYDAYLELDRAIFFLTQAVVRGMVAHGVVRGMVAHGHGGAIVNVGSMWAHQGVAATPASGYSVAKGSLHALTRDLAIELAPYQIRVNAVAPAVVATPIYERFVSKDQLAQTLHSFDRFHPLGRVGTPVTWPTPSPSCCPRPPAGSPAPSGTSTAASPPDTTNHTTPNDPWRAR